MKHYYVYKYVVNSEIIYIGLTDNLQRRIKEHASGVGLESKFLPYLDIADIYYHECGNETEMKALESLLINHYKPILNVVDVEPGESTANINVTWEKYDENKMTSEINDDLLHYNKLLKSNKTRILNYQAKQEALVNKMNKLRPFYSYIVSSFDELARNPYLYLQIPRNNLPMEDSLYVENRLVSVWYDEQDMRNDICFVQLSGEFLREFFAVRHHENWIEKTMDMIGNNECRALAVKIANLSRTNEKLKLKIAELKQELE